MLNTRNVQVNAGYTQTNIHILPAPLTLFSFHLSGDTMRIASSEFADDPCSSVKRGTMVRAARALLSAVTRLLILADMADVMRLLAHLKIVSADVNTRRTPRTAVQHVCQLT